MTRYPDRGPLTERPTHWPTTIAVVAYLLVYAAGVYGLWRLIHGIADAVSAVHK